MPAREHEVKDATMRLQLFGLLALPALLLSAQAFGQAKPIYNDQSITVLHGVAYTSRSFVAGTLYVEGSCAGSVNVVVRQMAVRRRLSAPNG